MKKREKNKKLILNIIKKHIENNLKQYFIISILFIIGVVIGVIVVNNMQIKTEGSIGTIITAFIENINNDNFQIDYIGLLKNILINHTILAVLLWFLGCSVIGIPIVYLIIAYRGFSLGYTISSIILILGVGKGISFSLTTLLLQNLLIIPALIAIAVSGTRLYSSIIQNNRMENIKIQIVKHTIFCILMLAILAISAIVEVYISSFLLMLVVK